MSCDRNSLAAALLAAVSAWCCFGAAGQALPTTVPSQNQSFALRGTVLNSVDGTPVRAALVQFAGEESRTALTDADGTFRFEGLRTRDGAVSVRKPGYFSEQEFHPWAVGERRVHLTADVPALELKLYPEAIVFGRLTNENGRPLEGMLVQLQRAGGKNAGRLNSEQIPAVSNENGEYRIAELKPGAYVLVASKKSEQDLRVARFITFAPSAAQSGYGKYFYPGMTDKSLATELHLTPGKQVQADMHLSQQLFYRVSGTVLGGKGEGPTIVVAANANDHNPVAMAQLQPGVTEFLLERVPVGNYLLAAIRPGKEEELQVGFTENDVRKNVEGVTIALQDRVKVPLRVQSEVRAGARRLEGNGPLMGAELVGFIRTSAPMDEGMLQAMPVRGQQISTMEYQVAFDVGNYRAKVIRVPNQCVASVKSGSMNLLKDDLAVTGPGSVEAIEVVVMGDCASVSGRVSKNAKPAMGMVLLIPDDAPRAGVSTAANSDGTFEISGLAPGKYWAMALEEGEDLEADDPATLERVKTKGRVVELESSGITRIELEQESLEK
jgi:hypothetical protein